MGEVGWLGYVLALIQAGTLLAQLWYACETHKLREATAQQTRLCVMPVMRVVLYKAPDKVFIENVGNGIATQVELQGFRFKPDDGNAWRHTFEAVATVPPGRDAHANSEVAPEAQPSGSHAGDPSVFANMLRAMRGEKVLLGFVQTATENKMVCAAFLRELVARGLCYQEGLLVVLDGSKGLRQAVREVFGEAAQIQRCQWHKRENVVSYLPKGQQTLWRGKLQRAYEQPTYEQAKGELDKLARELRLLNESAARSLQEGLDETLTLHRLGAFGELGRSFKTTNTLESIMAQVEDRIGKVDRWQNNQQKQRWLATALLDIEPRLRRLKGYRALPKLRHALQRTIASKEVTAA